MLFGTMLVLLQAFERLIAVFFFRSGTRIPRFLSQPQSTQLAEGRELLLECSLTNTYLAEIHWYYPPTVAKSRLEIVTQATGMSTLRVSPALHYDSGVYVCVAHNQAGLVQANATVSVRGE